MSGETSLSCARIQEKGYGGSKVITRGTYHPSVAGGLRRMVHYLREHLQARWVALLPRPSPLASSLRTVGTMRVCDVADEPTLYGG